VCVAYFVSPFRLWNDVFISSNSEVIFTSGSVALLNLTVEDAVTHCQMIYCSYGLVACRLAQIPLGSSRHVSTRHDTFDVSSASRRTCRAVLFDKLDTMRGLYTSNVSCRVKKWLDEPSGIWAYISYFVLGMTTLFIEIATSLPYYETHGLDTSNVSTQSWACHDEPVEPVELVSSVWSSTQPNAWTRHVECVASCRDVMRRAKWNWGFYKLILYLERRPHS